MSKSNTIIVLTGPTASGKTSMSIKIAKDFNCEIISADSRQVYKYLNIGTAKITSDEMEGIPHHLIDVRHPMDIFSVKDFVTLANQKIQEIFSRNKIPLIVGGTLYYIYSLEQGTIFPDIDKQILDRVKSLTSEQLFQIIIQKAPEFSHKIHINNRRRLENYASIILQYGKLTNISNTPNHRFIKAYIDIDTDKLKQNIHTRNINRITSDSLQNEVNDLLTKNIVSKSRLNDLGLEYKYTLKYIEGEFDKDRFINIMDTKTYQFAKKQMQWIRNKYKSLQPVKDYKDMYNYLMHNIG